MQIRMKFKFSFVLRIKYNESIAKLLNTLYFNLFIYLYLNTFQKGRNLYFSIICIFNIYLLS